MERQALGRTSEQPQQRSGSTDLQEGGQEAADPHVGSPGLPHLPLPCPVISRAAWLGHGASTIWTGRRGKGPNRNPGLPFSLTHIHTCPSHGGSLGQEPPSGPQEGQPSPQSSTHRAAVDAPSTTGLARIPVGTALQPQGSGARHLEVLLPLFGVPVPSGH